MRSFRTILIKGVMGHETRTLFYLRFEVQTGRSSLCLSALWGDEMKPHIKRADFPQQQRHKWICYSATHACSGETPKLAYNAWTRALQANVWGMTHHDGELQNQSSDFFDWLGTLFK